MVLVVIYDNQIILDSCLSCFCPASTTRGGPCEEPPSKVENFLMDVFEVSGCAGNEAVGNEE